MSSAFHVSAYRTLPRWRCPESRPTIDGKTRSPPTNASDAAAPQIRAPSSCESGTASVKPRSGSRVGNRMSASENARSPFMKPTDQPWNPPAVGSCGAPSMSASDAGSGTRTVNPTGAPSMLAPMIAPLLSAAFVWKSVT
ncbi:hypothetical protein [Sorangium sp. So ce341]|uniref:hypothetical protein n=1 Tax=Sorangium sp. So ce341 TaxID=3133302 RepID=UPI003F6072AD